MYCRAVIETSRYSIQVKCPLTGPKKFRSAYRVLTTSGKEYCTQKDTTRPSASLSGFDVIKSGLISQQCRAKKQSRLASSFVSFWPPDTTSFQSQPAGCLSHKRGCASARGLIKSTSTPTGKERQDRMIDKPYSVREENISGAIRALKKTSHQASQPQSRDKTAAEI